MSEKTLLTIAALNIPLLFTKAEARKLESAIVELLFAFKRGSVSSRLTFISIIPVLDIIKSPLIIKLSSMTLDVPAGTVDGDIIIFGGSCDGINGFTLPAGFTLLQESDTGGGHTNMLAYKIAASEPDNFTINVDGGANEKGIGAFLTYRGQSTTNPINESNVNNGGSDQLAIMTPITPVEDKSAVLVFVGTKRGNAGNPIASAVPATMTNQLDNVNGPTGNGTASSAAVFMDVIQSTLAEVSGNINLSLLSDVTEWGTMALVINPRARAINSLDSNTTREFAGNEKLMGFKGRFV